MSASLDPASVQAMMEQVKQVATNPPGPAAVPAAAPAPAAPVDRSADFDNQMVVAHDLLTTFQQIATSSPNAGQQSLIDQNVAELRAERDTLIADINTLENQASTDNSPFVEEAPAYTAIKRERIITLQDYILFILVASYGFATLALLFLIGKRTEWNKKILGYTAASIVIVTVLFYILVKRFA